MNGAAGERRNGRSVTALDGEGLPGQRGGDRGGLLFDQDAHLALARLLPVLVEVLAGGHRCAAQRDEGGAERGRFGDGVGERAFYAPPGGGVETHAGPLALDHHAGGHALHPAGGQPRHDLAPQDRGDLVAVQPVQDPSCLLGVDQAAVQLPPLLDRPGDRFGGDLVEDHALDRDRRRQHLEEMPRDRLALAVFVRGEIQLVRVLEQPLEIGHDRLLRGRHDIEGLEAVVHVDAEPGPVLALVRRGDFVGPPGEVADVTYRGLDDEVGAEQPADGAGLRRRLDDDQCLTHGSPVRAARRAGARTAADASVGRFVRSAWSRKVEGPAPACQGHLTGGAPRHRGSSWP